MWIELLCIYSENYITSGFVSVQKYNENHCKSKAKGQKGEQGNGMIVMVFYKQENKKNNFYCLKWIIFII